jgi:CRP-like cAMP-binding protein
MRYPAKKYNAAGGCSEANFQIWQEAIAIGTAEDNQYMLFGITVPPHSYSPGISIYCQGDAPEDVYYIQAGLIRLAYFDASGREIIVGWRRPGSLLGLAATILQTLHDTTAETITPCALRRVPARLLRNLLHHNPDFSAYVHRLHAQEIATNTERFIDLATKSTRHNLLKLLSQIVLALKQDESKKDSPVSIPIKQGEVARLLAVTPEHLNRILKTLEKQGLLLRKRDMVIIPDVERLISTYRAQTHEALQPRFAGCR